MMTDQMSIKTDNVDEVYHKTTSIQKNFHQILSTTKRTNPYMYTTNTFSILVHKIHNIYLLLPMLIIIQHLFYSTTHYNIKSKS